MEDFWRMMGLSLHFSVVVAHTLHSFEEKGENWSRSSDATVRMRQTLHTFKKFVPLTNLLVVVAAAAE